MEDWQKLIMEPLSRLEDSFKENVMVVMDALDESGAEHLRKAILHVLATYSAKLSANLQILLASWLLLDIGEVLNTNPSILVRSLDEIDNKFTMHNIHLYISTQLRGIGGTFSEQDFQQLTAKSNGIFEWACLACDFVSPWNGIIPNKAFNELMSHTPGNGRTLLDEMYTVFLKDLIRGSEAHHMAFCSVMQQIGVLWLVQPLVPISVLNFLCDKFPWRANCYPVSFVLNCMASLLAGATNKSIPVHPLHALSCTELVQCSEHG